MDLLALWLVCAVLCAAIAAHKGRSVGGWFIVGLVFGVFGLIVAAVISSNQREPCPECRERIMRDATTCPHCRTKIVRHRTSNI